MADLSAEQIETCLPATPCLSENQIQEYMEYLTEWKVIEQNQMKRLKRVYRFDNFIQAIRFTDKIAELSESVDHHPRLVIEWGRASVFWWTHSIGGLHKNDFIMAHQTDQVYLSFK
ncbi:MAG: 4a-hydroxytetrahydrobiopterin dehydratase [Proteobacteria bacterium]|nr:4a-hydroxytetrahydrobiopterin dehydratase [Pseudomonadota bacterium]